MNQLSSLRRAAVALTIASAFSSAYGVEITARIRGTVTDPTGAAIPNATVTAVNEKTGVKFNTTSSSSGDYTFQALPVGSYSIQASGSGFKAFSATGIVLTIDQEYVEAVHLQIGNANETVDVVADPVQVNSTDMQLDNVVSAAQMVELPLINRNFADLALTLPGVQAPSDRFGNFSVDGGQPQQGSFLINGADINDIALNDLGVTPNQDAIDQFNLVSGPLNAEYDRNSGAIISATVKQGTNHFHGDVFEFYRDTFLNTADFFGYNGPTTPKTVQPFHQNIFGATLGGPIFRDKLFFFGAYQGARERTPGSGGSSLVYSSAQRGGDFSDDFGANGGNLGYAFSTNPIPGTLTIPGCSNTTDTWASCAAKVGGKFGSAFNPIAAKLLTTYIPQANNGLNGFNFPSTNARTANQYIGRVDFSLNARNQFTGLYLRDKGTTTATIPFTGASVPGFGELDGNTTQQITFDYIHTFTPTLLNDVSLHYTRFNFISVVPQNIVTPASLGFSITPENAAAASVPNINTGDFQLGFSTNGPQPRIDQNYQIDDNMSKTIGHHSFKFGYDGRKFQVTNPFNARNSGSFGYNNASTYSSGDPDLDFLLGNPSSYSQGSGATIQAYALLNYFYAQDTWKVTDSLTLSYGMGYQVDTPLHSLQYGGLAVACYSPGQQSKIFPTAPTGLNYPGDKGCSNSAKAYTRYGDFGPRLGFAYTPELGFLSGGSAKKMSVRGGFGIYYNRTEEETALQNLQTPPFGLNSSGVNDYASSFADPVAPAFANPYQDINTGKVTASKFPFTFPTAGAAVDYSLFEPMFLNTYSSNFRSPYAENFQVSIEREFPSQTIARLTYAGSLAHHNQTTTEGNPVTPAGHAACLADGARCASKSTTFYRDYHSYFYPEQLTSSYVDPNTAINPFGAIGTVGSEGSSNYHSLQASITKAMTHGLLFQVSYTYSHALDEASSFENSGFGGSQRGYNQFQKDLNYGSAAFDARQRLVLAPVYVVPFHSSRSAFSPVNLALSGWQVSSITTFATGFPFDISYAGGSSNSLWCGASFSYYACPDEPDQVGPLVRTNPRARLPQKTSVTSWFQPTGFAVAPIGQFGNEHRNVYHGPGLDNTNVIFAKNIALSSDGVRRIQIRMETDNVFNHTNFANPASTVNASASGQLLTPTLGQINSVKTDSQRKTQLAAKIYF